MKIYQKEIITETKSLYNFIDIKDVINGVVKES